MPKKVLVVDDDPGVRAFLIDGLETFGYEVFSAVDGEEGLALAREKKPDLILLDLAMPRKHGFEVCETLRADAELAKIKIVVSSGKRFPADIRAAKDLGVDSYLIKPYSLEELKAAVEGLIGK